MEIRGRKLASLSDGELVELTRSGDQRAYAELWSRHVRAGRAVARAYTTSFDPDDLVSESFAKIFQSILDGGGPKTAFRAYLLQTVRNVAVSWSRKPKDESLGDIDTLEESASSEDEALAALDRGLTATAFKSLPERWQEILWYVEIERMKPQEIAPLLGMRANAVAALTYRAREGLRQAWIQEHLAQVEEGSEHKWTIEHLGAFARKGLGKRDLGKVEAHLSECASCAVIASEANEISSRLGLVVLPLSAGVAGAAVYTAWVNSGGASAAYAETPPETGERSRRRGLIVAGIGTGVTLAAIVTTAAIAGPILLAPTAGDRPHDIVSSPSSTSGGGGAVAHSRAPSTTPPPPTGTPAPTGVPSVPGAPVAPEGPKKQAPESQTSPSAVAAPVVAAIDTGAGALHGMLFPVVSGTAVPAARVTVTNGTAPPVTVTADASGAWSTPQLTGFSPGTNTVKATQTTPAGVVSAASAPASFTIAPAPSITATGGNTQFTVAVTGVPNTSVQLFADTDTGWGTAGLASTGTWQNTYQWFTTAGTHTLSIRYSTGTRFGPSTSTQVVITR